MWPRRSESLCVGLSADRIAWRWPASNPAIDEMARAHGPIEAIADGVFGGSAERRRVGSVNVVVGGSLARHWLQAPPPGLRSLAELTELAHSRAEQLFDDGSPWTVAADWHATRPFLCAAIPRHVDELANELARRGGAPRRLNTSLCAALSQHAARLPNDGWVVFQEPATLFVLHAAAGRIDHARSINIQPELADRALHERIEAEVARTAALAGGLDVSTPVVVSLPTSLAGSQAAAACELAGEDRKGSR